MGLVLAMLVCCGMARVEAQEIGGTFTEVVASVSAGTNTMLEIEEGRNSLVVLSQVIFQRNGPIIVGAAVVATYRVEFQLLDEAGQAVPLGESPGTPSVLSAPQTIVSVWPGPLVEGRVFVATLQPAAPLSHTQKYRLRANLLLINTSTSDPLRQESTLTQAEGQTYWHFANTDPDNERWNILGHAEPFNAAAAQNQIWQLNVPSRNLFFNSLEVTLRRADAWNRPDAEAASLAVETRVRARLKLINTTTATEVPLTDWSGGERVFSVPPFQPAEGTTPRQPSTFTGFVPCSFAPLTLDAINAAHRYRLEATIEHTDDAAGTVVTDNTVVYDNVRLAVLSGKLFFGEVETELSLLDPGSIAFDTTANPAGEVGALLHLQPGAASLVEPPRRGFPAATVPNLVVLLRPNGDLRLALGTVPVAGADSTRQQGVRVNRGAITLTPSGATLSQITIHLPAGLGYAFEAENGRLRASHTQTNVALNGRLEPVAPVAIQNPGGGPLYLVHERLPHRVRVSRIEWQAATGLFTAPTQGANTATTYVREAELAALESVRTQLVVPSDADRPSNEKYLRHAWVARSEAGGENVLTVRTDARGRALLDAVLVIPEVDCQAHFPLGVRLRTGLGQVNIRDSVVDTAGSLLTEAQPTQFYHSPGKACSGGTGGNGPLFTPAGNVWRFTPDGGLRAAGTIPARNLNFGLTADLQPVHSLLQVDHGRFHIPGHVLSGDALVAELPENAAAAVHRPAALLLTGFGSPDDEARVERPLTPAYTEGLADYAGFNVRATDGISVQSHLAGEDLAPYALKPYSKYYLRPSGVTGIHDAVTSDIVPLPKFYGYEITLDGLRLAYRDNVNVESAIGGDVTLPSPSGFGVTLSDVQIDVYGELLSARVVNPGQKTLAYWGMSFLPTSAEFAQPRGPGGCPVGGQGFLALNVKASLPAITDAPLYGRLGFKSDGNLVASVNAPGSGLDSRLVLPPTLTIKAQEGGRYRFTPVTGAALNRYDPAVTGFVSFAGLLDVPFFQDIKVHLHASASSVSTSDSPLYVMGGWSNDPVREARDHFGWNDGNGKNFFNDPNFDEDNRGWPVLPGRTVDDYRNYKEGTQLSQKYHPVARKVWRGVVDLDYSLQWDPARRTFTGFANPETKLLILDVHHELRTLSATGCAITFGAEVSTPRLNVSDLAAGSLVAVTQRAISRALDGVFSMPAAEMAARIDGLEKVVNDRISTLLDEALAQTLDEAGGVTDKVYDNLLAFYETGSVASRVGRLASLTPDGGHLNAPADLGLPDKVAGLATGASPALAAIRVSLVGAREVCDAALAVVAPDRRDKVRQAVRQLAEVGGLSESALAELNQAMADAESTLRESEAFLRRVRGTIQSFIDQIDAGTGLAQELERALQDAALTVQPQVLKRLRDHFAGAHDVTGRYFEEIPAARVKADISRVLREALCSGVLAEKVQPMLRARFNDVRDRFRSGLDLVFGEFNRVLRRAVEGAVTAAAGQFTELADTDGTESGDPADNTKVGDFFAAARLDGYAQIKGETIQEIRLNASLRMKVPDALVVDGWFRFLNCDSDTPNTSCRDPGVVSTEVTVGAHAQATFGVLPVEVSLEGKFSFDGEGDLVGLDGSFDLLTKLPIRQASLDRVAFKFGFGGGEGYLSGRVGATVDFVQMEGFCFFGSTKNPRALDLLDPETRDLVDFGALGALTGNGCFPKALTGFYQGFEGAVSINAFFRIPDTCFLSLKGLMGSGNFCFVQGSSDNNDVNLLAGVRYSYGIHGEILCLVDIEGKIGVAVAARIPIDKAAIDEVLLKPDAFVDALVNKASASGTASLRLSGKVGPCPFCKKFSKSFALLVTLSRGGGVDVGFK